MDSKLIHSKVKPESIPSGFKRGALLFLGDIASFNNFLLISLTYIVGIGMTSVARKIFMKKEIPFSHKSSNSYWKDIDIGESDPQKINVDSYYRPF